MRVKYFISRPECVKNIADEFKTKLKKKKKKLKKAGEDECDVVFVFLPIVSRTGTDIETGLSKIDKDFGEKPVILVVLHHTFDPEKIVSDSSKFVKRSGETCTVDCLFHEDKGLLKCKKNDQAIENAKLWLKLQKKALKEKHHREENKGNNKEEGGS